MEVDPEKAVENIKTTATAINRFVILGFVLLILSKIFANIQKITCLHNFYGIYLEHNLLNTLNKSLTDLSKKRTMSIDIV